MDKQLRYPENEKSIPPFDEAVAGLVWGIRLPGDKWEETGRIFQAGDYSILTGLIEYKRKTGK